CRVHLGGADFRLTEVSAGTQAQSALILCLNGNEAPEWAHEERFLAALTKDGHAVKIVDPRGVGALRVALSSRGSRYADPLSGVEENVAYNAFLVGESLV